ncbi:hypothetical protein GCM10011608_13830 [Micromonospora sonchi]|uniref:Copper chaperone PCu(A)C n=1 Tax=Micromonospora sonchi TaxID=1763543 RepID=A0A917WUQ8_9ACTN|nr:hypothetical protein [Micromonospora sonchi]GGM30494.1 hypothetical protein GCM10011608_13830 [Micromonospora sonchi]
MTRSIKGARRAAVLLSGIATAGLLLLSGCGAGQVSETANKVPSIQGIDLQATAGKYGVRSVLVAYPGVEGYRAGDNAVLNALFYNDTYEPVTVTVTSPDAREVVITTVSAATSPSPTGSPTPTASPSSEGSPGPDESAAPGPSESPAAGPARIEIPPLGYVQLNTSGERVLQLIGLNSALLAGETITLSFDFGNGDTVTSPAPVAVPLSPAPPPSPIIERHTEYEGGH